MFIIELAVLLSGTNQCMCILRTYKVWSEEWGFRDVDRRVWVLLLSLSNDPDEKEKSM